MTRTNPPTSAIPTAVALATGALILADGTVFWGRGLGAKGRRVGELCFNTSISGYQEILSDPSYAGQIITFTFPHIGNVGTNPDDAETTNPGTLGLVLRADITTPSNFRAKENLACWLDNHNLVGISGVDTRRLTRRIREHGYQHAAIVHGSPGLLDVAGAQEAAANWPGIEGMDLAKGMSCQQAYQWRQTEWREAGGYGELEEPKYRVVAVDFGVKRNILRCLAGAGCAVTVVPATATANDIMSHRPDGLFLSNGPGDPAATGAYAAPMIRDMLDRNVPIFGICLGYQMLALALGAHTEKMSFGHRGANHPVRDLATGKVEITSQNHGFAVTEDSLPDDVRPTHRSLFDGSLEGIAVTDRPIFGVQHHPEASPGPQDSYYLFARFVNAMNRHAETH